MLWVRYLPCLVWVVAGANVVVGVVGASFVVVEVAFVVEEVAFVVKEVAFVVVAGVVFLVVVMVVV